MLQNQEKSARNICDRDIDVIEFNPEIRGPGAEKFFDAPAPV